jgi:GDPmannose 4,6-dehydratase
VEIDPRYFRPAEVEQLCGDAAKARRVLGWAPTVGVRELAAMMVEHDLEQARRERTLRDAGHAMPEASGHDQ